MLTTNLTTMISVTGSKHQRHQQANTGALLAARAPAVYGDWSVLAELFLGLVHLSDEVDESLAGLGNTLLRPVGELELAQRPRLTVLRPQSSAATGQSCNKSDLVSLTNETRKTHELYR